MDIFGIKAHRLNNSYTDVFEVSFLLFIEVIEEGLVLINCNIQRALFQTLVRGNVVRKFNHLNIQALLLGHFCCFLDISGVRTGRCADFKFSALFIAASGKKKRNGNHCCGSQF